MKRSDAAELLQFDFNHIWHPYTQMKDFEERPLLFIDRAEGIFLYDIDGNRYYDTISSWWCVIHGHNHPVIKKRIREQMDRLEQLHFAAATHEGPIRLVKRLLPLLPESLTRFFFSDNGSTANEVALKISIQYWKQTGRPEREKFVSLERGYHGDTIGALSLGGVPFFEGPFSSLMFDSFKVPPPYCYRCPFGQDRERCQLQCADAVAELFSEHGQSIAAMIMEPMLIGAGGMISYPAPYLERVGKLCREHGIHLILDEVATGFGRTGKMFGFEHAGVQPDFLCLSKGLTGGYLPLALTVTTEQIYNAFYADYSQGKTFFHGHTYTANPLGVAAALGSLDVFQQEQVVEKLPGRSACLQNGAARFQELEHVGDVRGIGMAAAFELVQDKDEKRPYDPDLRMGWQVYLAGLEKGLILRPLADVVYLMPPLCIEPDQIEDILERTYDTIRDVTAGVGG